MPAVKSESVLFMAAATAVTESNVAPTRAAYDAEVSTKPAPLNFVISCVLKKRTFLLGTPSLLTHVPLNLLLMYGLTINLMLAELSANSPM